MASATPLTKEGSRRLLFFVTEDWYFVSHRMPLAMAARDAGYEVTVVTRVREHGDAIRAAGLHLVPFEIARGGLNPVRELATLVRLLKVYRQARPHVAHHVAMKPVIYGSIAARFVQTPCIINALAGMGWLFISGTGLARWLKPIVRWLLGRLLKFGIALVQNPDDARLLIRLGIPEDRLRIIPGSGVDLGVFTFQLEPNGIPLIVLPARLLWDKGVGEFAAAAKILKQRGISARFMLAGEPDDANPSAVPVDQLRKWVEEGLVENPGWIKEIPQLLASCAIVCLPSYREGLPKSLLEAAAAGRPIVTTDVPGCREVVHHEDNGLLVPPRDAGALAEALERLITDSNLRRLMGARGRVRAERNFGLEAIIQQTLALYE